MQPVPSIRSEEHQITLPKVKQIASWGLLTLFFSALSYTCEGFVVRKYLKTSIARSPPGRRLWRFYHGYFFRNLFSLRIGAAGACSSLVFNRFSGVAPISVTKLICGSVFLEFSWALFQSAQRNRQDQGKTLPPSISHGDKEPLEVVCKVFTAPDLFFKIFKDCKGAQLALLPTICRAWQASFHSTQMFKHLFGMQTLQVSQVYQFLHHPSIVERREGQLGEGMSLNLRLDCVEDIHKLRGLIARYPYLERLHLFSYLKTNESHLLKEVFERLTEVIDFEAEEKDLNEGAAITLPANALTLTNPLALAKLKTLRLRSNGLSDADLISIFNRAHSLEKIDLSASDNITGGCFVDLSPEALRNLKDVKCSFIRNLGDRGLHSLFERTLLLENLSLSYCHQVTAVCFREFPARIFSNLIKFELNSIRNSESLIHVWERARNLEILILEFAGRNLEGISTLRKLREFTFSPGGDIEIDDEVDGRLKNIFESLKQLRYLEYRSHQIEGQIYHFDTAEPLSEVRTLSICTSNVTDAALSKLLNQTKKLKVLKIESCSELSGEGLALDTSFLWELDRLQFCNQSNLNDTFLLHILSKVRSLRQLIISPMSSLTGRFLEKKEKLSQLRELKLGCRFSQTAIGEILNCAPLLKKLNLEGIKVDPTDFRSISPNALANLRTFFLTGWFALADVDLGNIFVRTKKLKILVLSSYENNLEISGECFHALDPRTLAQIKEVYLSGLWGLDDAKVRGFLGRLTGLQSLTLINCPTLTTACFPRESQQAFSHLKTFKHNKMELSVVNQMIAFIKERSPYCNIDPTG